MSECISDDRVPFSQARGTKALDIVGFGPKMVEKLMAAGLLHTVADLFRLRSDDFVGMEGVGEVLASKLVAQVGAKRRLPLVAFLTALGVEGLGEVTTRTLAERFRSLETILDVTTPSQPRLLFWRFR